MVNVPLYVSTSVGINVTFTVTEENGSTLIDDVSAIKTLLSDSILVTSKTPFPPFEMENERVSLCPANTFPKSSMSGSTSMETLPVTFMVVINSADGVAGSLLRISSSES